MAKRKPYRIVLYLFFRATAFLLGLMPRRVLLGLARQGGKAAFVLVPRHRKAALKQLQKVYGQEKSEAEIRHMACRVFENLAQTGAELVGIENSVKTGNWKEIIDFGNAPETYNALLEEGKGLISVTAHIGNWELLAGAMALRGFRGAVLGRRLRYERYDRWVVNKRLSMRVRTIYRDQSPKELLRLLKRNEIVGLLPDQDIDSIKGIFIPFFGRPAYTPTAPAKLSLMSGAPIVPNFLIRQPGGRYRVLLGNIIRPQAGVTKEASIRAMTFDWMNAFEEVIRQYPDQWAWMHDRWKTKAEDISDATTPVVAQTA